jgi:hypothetical protein
VLINSRGVFERWEVQMREKREGAEEKEGK